MRQLKIATIRRKTCRRFIDPILLKTVVLIASSSYVEVK